MYHKSNLGKYAGMVERFADLDGYVPELGDAPGDFRWADNAPPYEWDSFVILAVIATDEANTAIAGGV